jgi:hypothetical protein
MTDQPRDAFPCAAGSDAPTRILLSNDPKVRCPECAHRAVLHDPEQEGTCDVCSAIRITVNSLVAALRAQGVDLTATPQEDESTAEGPSQQ